MANAMVDDAAVSVDVWEYEVEKDRFFILGRWGIASMDARCGW